MANTRSVLALPFNLLITRLMLYLVFNRTFFPQPIFARRNHDTFVAFQFPFASRFLCPKPCLTGVHRAVCSTSYWFQFGKSCLPKPPLDRRVVSVNISGVLRYAGAEILVHSGVIIDRKAFATIIGESNSSSRLNFFAPREYCIYRIFAIV